MSISGSGLEITGLRETIRNLERYGADVSDLKAAFQKIGNIVVGEAQSLAPKKSGALAASIRPSNTKNKSIVRAGSARVPYAGVQHFGWPRRNIKATNYLYKASESKQAEVLRTLEEELERIANRLGL